MSRANWMAAGFLIFTLSACGENSTGPLGQTAEQQAAATIPFASLGTGQVSFNRSERKANSGSVIYSRYVLDVNARTVSIQPIPADEETRISPDGQSFASLRSTYTNGAMGWDLYITDRNGGSKRMTTDGGPKNTPNWSYDGSRIYYVQTIASVDVIMQVTAATGAIVQFAKPGRGTFQVRTFKESSTGVFLFASTDTAGKEFVPSFLDPGAIFSIRGDGTARRQLTPYVSGRARTPVWSPDGTKFAFGSYGSVTAIMVANADGTNLKEIVNTPVTDSRKNDYSICWTGDGSRILFNSHDQGNLHVFSVRPDGSDLVKITSGSVDDANVSCSH